MKWIGWGVVGLVPLVLLVVLLRGLISDPVLGGPVFHFYVVSLASIQALLLALLMLVAANQLRNARVFFLAMAFLSIAGIFLVHALTTPGVIVPNDNPFVGPSARLSLLAGSIFFGLSTIHGRRSVQEFVVRQQTLIMLVVIVGMVAYAGVALLASSPSSPVLTADYDDYGPPQGSASQAVNVGTAASFSASFAAFGSFLATPLIDLTLSAVALGLMAIVIWRYIVLFRLTRGPLLAGFLVSAVFLFQAELSMDLAPVWHASWWEYHGLLLASFGAALLGIVLEYRQTGSLGAVIEGLLLRDTIAQLQRGYTEVIVALVEVIEAKDPYTRGHTQRVSEMATLIGQELGLSPERLRTLHQAAMLHDIGKIAVPDSILNKPGRLTPEEFALIQEHPVRGHQIIRNVRSLQQEIGGVRHHHERLDGSGYPDGLVGAAIPLDARIIAVADVFDALTSERAYRGAWPLDRAIAEIDAESRTKLDPSCVAALHRVLTGRVRPSWLDPATIAPPVLTEAAVASVG
jgi:hypothetical protein